jgi:hypothetical protein
MHGGFKVGPVNEWPYRRICARSERCRFFARRARLLWEPGQARPSAPVPSTSRSSSPNPLSQAWKGRASFQHEAAQRSEPALAIADSSNTIPSLTGS